MASVSLEGTTQQIDIAKEMLQEVLPKGKGDGWVAVEELDLTYAKMDICQITGILQYGNLT